jgi:hypothetical protein
MPRIPNWLFYWITAGVLLIWGAGVFLSAFWVSFHMPPELSSVVAVIIGALYGSRNTRDDDDDDNDDGPGGRRRGADRS